MNLLVLGANGQVGWELARSLAPLGRVLALGREGADLARPEDLRAIVLRERPAVVVNAAAYTAVDRAETDRETAQRVNADAVGVLARAANDIGAWIVHYSTDYVFDGAKAAPYVEDDATAPLSVYGATKLAGEVALRKACARHLLFRTSWVYSARGANFARTILRLARERDALRVVADQHGAPTAAELIADVTALALSRVLLEGAGGLARAGTYHLAAAGSTSWHGYAQRLLEFARARGATLKVAPEAVQPIPATEYPLPAARPRNSRLDCSRLERTFGLCMPDWTHHLARVIDQWVVPGDAPR